MSMSVENSKKDHPYYEDHQGHLYTRMRSAEKMISILKAYYMPSSVVDLGCGVGAWLKTWLNLGAKEIKGLDLYSTTDALLIDEAYLEIINLNEYKPELNKKYDLAMSLEVAEHLEIANTQKFVETLTNLSDVVMFSAAIPLQPGNLHINCQPPEYWANIFKSYSYHCIDCLRHQALQDDEIEWWYSQNTLLYVNDTKLNHFLEQGLATVSKPNWFYSPYLVEMLFNSK